MKIKGNKMSIKQWLLGLCCLLLGGVEAATPSITSVTAQQRYPWNGKMDVSYKVTGDIAGYALTNGVITSLKVTAKDNISGKSYTATKLSGDRALTAGTHSFVWDMAAEGLNFKSTNVSVSVACEATDALYCVIDLSAGANATRYPVSYLAAAPSGGFTNDTYRTTKLVLRRCNAGTFLMQGSTTTTLTKPFYMGVFEVTQKQWMLVMGAWPNSVPPSPSYGSGDDYPAYYVSYNNIRGSSNGAKWPGSSAVDATSFIGKLWARTKLNFDLPTEAQWEYACRAGTTTSYYWGSSMNGAYAWYKSNSRVTSHPVGTKKPNAWGLYDMSGNVWEFCLDWHGTLAYGTDPKGSSSGSKRVIRGGSWDTYEECCTSPYRTSYTPSSNYFIHGFRLSRTLP